MQRKIRVYCPRDNVGFVTEQRSEIFCRSGNHLLSSEFPPKKDFWCYCCGCQRFFPLPLSEEKTEYVKACISCTRNISQRYLCSVCNTLLLDTEKPIINNKHLSKTDDGVILNCPSCETISGEGVKLKFHDCEILERSFLLSRESCPFCGGSTDGSLNLKLPYDVDSVSGDVPETFDEIHEDFTAHTPPAFETRKKLNEPYTNPIAPFNVIDNSAQTNVEPKRNLVKSGCLIFLIVIFSCAFGSILQEVLKNFPTDVPTNDEPSVSFQPPINNQTVANLEATPQTSNKSVNTPTPVTKKPSPKPIKTSSFRNNSKVTSDFAILRKEPEDDSEIIATLLTDTLIRVKDRKSLDSQWYKIKTENGEEGWIQGKYITPPDWNSVPCRTNEIAYFSGGNLRSSPYHSVDEENILAVWSKNSKVKILGLEKGEFGAKTNNPFWYKIRVLSGTCNFDERNAYMKTYSCKEEIEGYMHSNLLDCD